VSRPERRRQKAAFAKPRGCSETDVSRAGERFVTTVTPLDHAEERYAAAGVEARAEDDGCQSAGAENPPPARRESTLRELLAAQLTCCASSGSSSSLPVPMLVDIRRPMAMIMSSSMGARSLGTDSVGAANVIRGLSQRVAIVARWFCGFHRLTHARACVAGNSKDSIS
jgi:hypothetical protein